MKRSMLILPLTMLLATNAQSAELIVKVTHIENDRGTVRVAVHQLEKSYLDDKGAFRQAKTAAAVPEVTVHFPRLPTGRYAIKVFHDGNEDGILNRNFFGAPTEPYGISNNVRASFSLPPFDEALVAVSEPQTQAEIRIDNQ